MRSLAVVLATVACCGMTSASPSRQRRSLFPPDVILTDGIPLAQLFEACGGDTGNSDIGPCVETLLQGVIDLAKPSFSTGLEVGGKTIVLEPLALKDFKPKKNKPNRFQLSGKNILISGLTTLSISNVSLQSDRVAFNLNFTQLNASGELGARYSIIRANMMLLLTLNDVGFHVMSDWGLEAVDGKLAIRLSNVNVSVDIDSIATDIDGLPGLGGFLKNLINSNDRILLDLFEPKLEEKLKELLEKELSVIKIGRI